MNKNEFVFETSNIDEAVEIIKEVDIEVTDMFEKEIVKQQMNTEQLLDYISTLPITKSVTLKEYYKMNKKK